MYKKARCTCKVVVLLNQPIALTPSLPSPSSLLKLPDDYDCKHCHYICNDTWCFCLEQYQNTFSGRIGSFVSNCWESHVKVEKLSIYSFFFSFFFNAALPTGTYRHSTDYINTYYALLLEILNVRKESVYYILTAVLTREIKDKNLARWNLLTNKLFAN